MKTSVHANVPAVMVEEDGKKYKEKNPLMQ